MSVRSEACGIIQGFPRVNLVTVTCERVVYAVLILLLHTFQYGCTCTQPRQPHDTDAHVTQDARCLLQVTDASKTLLSSRMRVRHCCLLLYTDDADMSRPQVVTYHCILYLIWMHLYTTQTVYQMLCCVQLVPSPRLSPYGCECETRFLATHRCTCTQHCLCLMSVVGLCILPSTRTAPASFGLLFAARAQCEKLRADVRGACI